MLNRLAFSLLYFLSPLLPLAAVYNADPFGFQDPKVALARLCSTAAYTWLVFEFILSSRPKFAEESFGMDWFYRLHSFMAVVAVILVFVHRTVLKKMGEGEGVTGDLGNIAWLGFVAVVVLGLIFLIESFITRTKAIKVLRENSARLSLFKRENQVRIHNLVAVAYLFMLFHVLHSGAAEESPQARLVLIAYWTVGAAFYVYHKVAKPLMLRTRPFTIVSVTQESQNMWTLQLRPAKGVVFVYKPGQFAWIQLFGAGLKSESHPFSMTSSPTDKSQISFTIKELGDFTSTIKNAQVGYKVLVDGAYGTFSYVDYPDEKGIVLIVGGVGIAPALSMLRYIRTADNARNVTLIWGANTQTDLICMPELEALKEDVPNCRVIPVLFRDDTYEGEKGVIDAEKIDHFVSECGLAMDSLGFYICGPGPMLDSVLASLKSLGVRRKRIHYERFSM